MARAKAKRGDAEISQTHIRLKPVLEVTDDTPVYYVNYADLASNMYELSIAVGRFPTKPTAESLALGRETGELIINAELQLIFPLALLNNLITALDTQKKLHESQHGPLPDFGVPS